MAKLKCKFHFSFIIFAVLLCFFKQFNLLISLILASIIHELGHFIVSEKLGYKLNSIVLMPYGASLNGSDIYVENKHEILIAIAGPITSLIVAIVTVALWWIFPKLIDITGIFTMVNLSIFAVNLLPIFPLDGGRILGAILKNKMPLDKALKITKSTGFFIIICLFILYIVSSFFTINYSLALFIIFTTIALFFSKNNEKYVLKSKIFSNDKNLIKGVKVNIKAISELANLLELYKLLEPNSLNYVIVLDKNRNTSFTLNDTQIQYCIMNFGLDITLANLKNNYEIKKLK